MFAPLIVLTLWMGIYPSSFTSFFDATVAAMVQHHHRGAGRRPTKLAGNGALMNWTSRCRRSCSPVVAMAILIFGVLRKQDSYVLSHHVRASAAFLLAGLLVVDPAHGVGYQRAVRHRRVLQLQPRS